MSLGGAMPLRQVEGLGVRLHNQLIDAELRTVSDVAALTDHQLRRRGIGPKSLEKLREFIPYSPDANALRRVCSTCRFFHHIRIDVECHRHPPVRWERSRSKPDGTTYHWGQSYWPEVKHDDWCGEWKGLS